MPLTEKLQALDVLRSEIDALRPIDAGQERRVLDKFRLDWNYNSNAMEGNTLSIGETAALLSYGLTAKGKPLKDHLDIEGHNKVLEVLADLVRNQEPLTESLVRSLHQVMLGTDRDISSVDEAGLKTTRTITVGQYKKSENHILTETGVVRRFASPSETPALMAALIDMYRQEKQAPTMHPVLFAAIFHHRLVSIHPFDDGNGRMARILMNLLLMQNGYLPAILSLQERNLYLASLVQADAGEMTSLFELIADACVRSAQLYWSAAKGDPVDDLQDFDKQLALLTQSVLTQANSGEEIEGSPATHLAVFDGVLVPVFESVVARIRLLSSLFAQEQFVFEGKFRGNSLVLENSLDGYKSKVGPMLKVGDQLFTESHLYYQGNGYIADASTTFLISVKCSFHLRRYAITTQAYLVATHEIFSAAYDDVITSADVEAISRKVLESVVESVKKLTKS